MFILSKDKQSIINLNMVTSLYISSDGYAIKAAFDGTNGCQINRYNSREATIATMQAIGEAIGKTECYIMPSDEEAQAKIYADAAKIKERHKNGAKTKGHGGS